MPKRRPGWLLRGPLLAASSSLALVALAPGSGEAALRQIVLSGTVDFVGCPEPISCASFPSMWAVSGGEPASARLVYDDQSPLAFLDDQSPEYVAARYDHALPLAAPLAVEVGFGPYSAFAGAGGAAVERHAIHLFDDLGSTCCPDLSELASVETTIPAAALALPAPPGFHELELRGVRLDFLNYAGGEDLLDGAPLPPGFPELAWQEIRLTVDVFDPVAGRAGRAFLSVESLELSDLPAVPSLSGIALAALLAALAGAGTAALMLLPRARR